MDISRIFRRTSILFLTLGGLAAGQGVTRPHGIGIRPSFWNMSDHTFHFSLSTSPGKTGGQVSVSGIGSWIYFFSRLNQNLFMQFEMGAVATAYSEGEDLLQSNTNVSTMIPLLIGLRYDLLSGRSASKLQPYLAVGAGPYWSTAFTVQSKNLQEEIVGDSKMQYGGYIGGGVHLLLTDWMALNFNVRQHFVDGRVNNEYSGMEFGLGLSVMWGRNKEIFQIKDIKLIVKDLYPAYFRFYNTYPLALVTVRNTAGYAIEINIRGNIEGFSQRPQESGFIRLERGETRDIPVHALFSSTLLEIDQRKAAILDLVLEARAGATLRKQISASIMIHHRNAWDGDAEKLPLYVTAENAAVLSMGRAMVHNLSAGETSDNLAQARAVFDSLSRSGLVYRRDPNIPFYKDDRVQFAEETMREHGGDCDDLVVLYASLLQSLGISTAFVEVRDPAKEMAHLYLMFDSGVKAGDRLAITQNEKRIVVRTETDGTNRVWIPVETTLIGRSFTEAWNAGAMQWYQDTELRQGVVEGWVKWIEVGQGHLRFDRP
jgi:hypothetical protein